MARLARFTLHDGASIVAEVDDEPATPGRATRNGGTAKLPGLAIKTDNTFESALDYIRTAAESMLNRLTSLAQPAGSLAIEFGVKLNVETEAVIASAPTEANFTINLKWAGGQAMGCRSQGPTGRFFLT